MSSTLRHTLRITLLALAAVLLVASAGIVWLCYTASGLSFALAQLNHVKGLQVQVQGVQGRLAGPLQVQHLVLDHEHVRIEVDALQVSLTPALLLSGLIQVDQLHIGKAVVQYKQKTKPSSDKPLYFLPGLWRLRAQMQIDHAEYRHTNGYVLVVNRASGNLSLSHRQLLAEELLVNTPDFDVQGKATISGGAVLNLDSAVNAIYRVPTGVVLNATVQASGSLTGAVHELRYRGELTSPHVATTQGVLKFPDAGWSISGAVQAETVQLDPWWTDPTFSLRKVQAAYQLDAKGIYTQADATLPEISPARIHLDADTHYGQRVFTIRRAQVSVPATAINAVSRGTITLRTNAKPLVAITTTWGHVHWPLQVPATAAVIGSDQGTFTVRGDQPYQFELAATAQVPQLAANQIEARGEFRPGEVVAEAFTVRHAAALATGSARWGFAKPNRWQFILRGERFDPSQWLASWPGAINVELAANGVGYTRDATFDVTLRSLGGSLRGQALSGSGRLQHQRERWQATQLQARWGTLRAAADGVVGPENSLRVALTATELAPLQLGVAGDVQLNGEFYGKAESLWLRAQATANRLSYAGWQAQQLQLDTQVDLTDGSDSNLSLQLQQLLQGTAGVQNLRVTGTGRVSNHQVQLQATPVSNWLPDKLNLTAQLNGAYGAANDVVGNTAGDAAVWRGLLNTLQVTDAQQTRVQLEQPATWLASSNQWQLASSCLRIDGGRVCAEADALRTQTTGMNWRANLNVTALPLSISNRALVNDAHIEAVLNAALRLQGNATQPWLGTAKASLDQASIRYRTASGREQILPVTLAQVEMNADAATVTTNAELRLGVQTVSSLTSVLQRTGNDLGASPLSGVLSLSSSDAKLIPVFVENVDRADGTLAGVAQLSGTLAQPKFAGTFKLLKGELDFYQWNLALRDLEVDATLNETQLSFVSTGRAGAAQDSGVMTAKGQFNWQDAKAGVNGALQLQGERLLLADLPEYKVYASPDLNFDIKNKAIHVSGKLLIPEARLQPKEVVGAVQSSTDARFKNEVLSPKQSSDWRVTSDVTVQMGQQVNFDGLGLQGRLTGSVATRLRGESALGDGELAIENGRYEAYGQKLNIQRGRLIYDNSSLADPGLDIQAERAINEITVGVYVRGVLREPRLNFYSSTSMSQTQIVSYLLMGKPLDELQGTEATTVRSASNTLALQGGGYLAAQLGRRIGLEEVGVETDSNNASSFVLGKFLSPRLFVSYGISLSEAVNTVKLRYTLSDHWLIKTEAGSAKSADIQFKIEH